MTRLFAGCCLAALLAGGRAAASSPPMTFQELFREQQIVDSASFSPDGKRLLYTVRHNGVPTDGLTLSPTSRESWVEDLATGRRQRIGGTDTGGAQASPCGAWDPDGSGVAVLTDRGGLERLGFYNLARDKFEVFGPPPTQLCVRWLGRMLVYPAATPDAPLTWSKRQRLQLASDRWTRAWTTQQAETSVASNNPAFPAPVPAQAGLAFADPATGRSGIVARGNFRFLAPSPDGRTLAVIEAGAPDPRALDRMSGRRGRLELFRIGDNGAALVRAFDDYDVASAALAWSPAGRRLLFGARKRGASRAGLFVFDARHPGVAEVPLPAGVQLTPPRPMSPFAFQQLGWIAGEPAYIAAIRTQGRRPPPDDAASDYGVKAGLSFELFVAWNGRAVSLSSFTRQAVDRFAVTPSGDGLIVTDGALWRVHPCRPARRVTSPGLKVMALAGAPALLDNDAVASAQGGRADVLARGPGGQPLRAAISLDTGAPRIVTPKSDLASWSPGLRSAARLEHDGWASRLEVVGAHTRAVASFNPAWRSRPLGQLHPFSYEVDGRQLRGWLITPPGYNSGPLPTIVWIYGGEMLSVAPPGEATVDGGPNPVYDGQLWAAKGYAVLYPSTPIGRGADTDVRKALADDTVAAIDAAAKAGWVDPERVGLIGHSFGGYSTAAVLSRRSDRFRAGIAMSGPFDFLADWGARSAMDRLAEGYARGFALETRGTIEEGQAMLEKPPWEAWEAYRRLSPMYHPRDIRTPLMITAGDLEGAGTGLEQSERLYAALQRTGNPAVLVRYWGEGHVQEDPGAVEDQWNRFSAWFAHYLKGPSVPMDEVAGRSGNPAKRSAIAAPMPRP